MYLAAEVSGKKCYDEEVDVENLSAPVLNVNQS